MSSNFRAKNLGFSKPMEEFDELEDSTDCCLTRLRPMGSSFEGPRFIVEDWSRLHCDSFRRLSIRYACYARIDCQFPAPFPITPSLCMVSS